jgi:hypothetical protein
MRAYARNFYLLFVRGEWHLKTKTLIEADSAVSPHPNPLPAGEGNKNFPSDLRIDEPRSLWRVSGNEPANLTFYDAFLIGSLDERQNGSALVIAIGCLGSVIRRWRPCARASDWFSLIANSDT